LNEVVNQLDQCRSINIKGGGIVGIELLFELVSKYRDKEINLYIRRGEILSDLPKRV